MCSSDLGKTDQFVFKFRKPANAPNTDKRPKDDPIKHWYGNTFVLGTPTKRFRTIFYHADHTFQENGMKDTQAAYWYWAADGQNCMLHQFPAEQEGFVTCHPFSEAHRNSKLNETFNEIDGTGRASLVTIVPGRVYPNVDKWPTERD